MLSRRKTLAALAAVITTFAAAVPEASASFGVFPFFGPTPLVDPTVCQLLGQSSSQAPNTTIVGSASLQNTLANAGAIVNCPSSAPQQPLSPFSFGLGG
jgi:hypothetical protein